MASKHHGREALAAFDEILREKPKADGHLFSQAARNMAAYRDAMIEQHPGHGRTATQRQQLEHVNAIISVVLAGHFPLGSVPWPEIEAARSWLAEVLKASGTPR